MSGRSLENVVGSNVFSPEVGGTPPLPQPPRMIFVGAISVPCKLHQNTATQDCALTNPSAWRSREDKGKEIAGTMPSNLIKGVTSSEFHPCFCQGGRSATPTRAFF